MTLLTDLLLGGVALMLALRLRGASRAPDRRAAAWWSVALLATGIAAICGGLWHGFFTWLEPLSAWVLWRVTVWSIGLGSCAMLLATIHARVAQRRRLWRTLAIGQFVVYAAWMLLHHEFFWVILDYAPAMLVVLGLHGWAFWRSRPPADGWIVAGVLVSIVGAAIQALELAPHPRFNHNDLYHVIQIGALWCFFRGASALRDLPVPKEP
jgi:hypothetical protein